MNDVTRILSAIDSGDPQAAEQFLPPVYEELRKLAGQRIGQADPGQTLQATALVHEADLRLVDVDRVQQWDSRGHFVAAAAEAMRRILTENARRKQSQKRAGVRENAQIDEVAAPPSSRNQDLAALDEALTEFERRWPDKAALVKLRYFAGLTTLEAARASGVSIATADRFWTFARTWLHAPLKGDV